MVAIVGVLLWYSSRPAPPQRWNKNALVATEPPGFDASKDGKRIVFTYSVENTTNTDYSVDSIYGIKVLIRDKGDSLSQPLSEDTSPLRLPIFIPAKQRGRLTVSLTLSGIPVQATTDTDAEYHEQLRIYCEKHLASIAGFVLFDDTNRYQVNLPRWRSEPTKAN